MTISMVQPLPIGNAIRLFLRLPAGALNWLVLKMGADDFDSLPPISDAETQMVDGLPYVVWPGGAMVPIVYDGNDRTVVDAHYLVNEIKVFYRAYYQTASGWIAGDTRDGTPSATFETNTTDVQSFVRERLESAMKVECDRGRLVAEGDYVQVLTAPPSLDQNLRFPLITITLDNESPAERGIGEDISGDEYNSIGDDWFDAEGWLAQVQLSIVGWSLNSDERIELRKCIREAIIANFPVFESRGMTLPSIAFQDVDALNGEYNVNMYQVFCSFSCMAPVRVGYHPTSIKTTEVEYPDG